MARGRKKPEGGVLINHDGGCVAATLDLTLPQHWFLPSLATLPPHLAARCQNTAQSHIPHAGRRAALLCWPAPRRAGCPPGASSRSYLVSDCTRHTRALPSPPLPSLSAPHLLVVRRSAPPCYANSPSSLVPCPLSPAPSPCSLLPPRPSDSSHTPLPQAQYMQHTPAPTLHVRTADSLHTLPPLDPPTRCTTSARLYARASPMPTVQLGLTHEHVRCVSFPLSSHCPFLFHPALRPSFPPPPPLS
jgi:hypothetical protein